MTDIPNNDPRATDPSGTAEDPKATEQPKGAETTGDATTGTTWSPPTDDAAQPVQDEQTGDEEQSDDGDDLGAGAFDVPDSGADDDASDAATDSADAGAEGAGEHDDKPKKAYLGRPELAPLYAMAGLADLAAAAVRDIANEQIAAYRSRRTKSGDVTGTDEQSTEAADAQFNAFLAKAQQRTQEIFDQAVAQYGQLADRGRVAVGEAIENARHQQKSRGPEDLVGMKPEDVSAAAQKAADKIAAAVQTAADRVGRAADESAGKTTNSDAPADSTDPMDSTGPADAADTAAGTDDKPASPQV